jgi:hypothetical protein
MKRAVSVLIIYLVLVVASYENVFAQISPMQKVKDEQRVRITTTLFIKRFYQTYDIRKIPKSFLVDDFWSHFENDVAVGMLGMPSSTLKKLTTKERTEYFRSIIDCWVLLDFYAGTAKDENLSFAEILPKSAIQMLKSSIFLNGLLKNDSDTEREIPLKTLTVKEYRLLFEEFNRLTILLRRTIKNRTKSQNLQYSEYSSKMKERFHRYRKEVCTGKGCYGLPENSEIFFLTDFPLTFSLIKRNGKFKIFGLFPTFD